ncbi:MAG TPA: hypothetical protein VF972_07680, partial [Actinomycetota bacterium]
ALVAPLAIIRVVNFDAVDGFLAEIGAGEDVRRDIDVASDIGVVRRYIYFLGIYNNAVHQALHYPKMRRQLLVGGLQALVDAKGPGDFNSAYTRVVLAMLRQARYRLIEWTKPD